MDDAFNLTFKQALLYYNDLERQKFLTAKAKKEFIRLLGRTDLFFLLTAILHREDVGNEWLYNRCREVQAEPDGCLDLWAREHYKDLADDTPILTANRGWVSHGDINVNDLVFSPDGEQIRVLAVTEQYVNSDCYKITFSDGAEIVAGAGHRWNIREKKRTRIHGTNKRFVWFRDVETTTLEMFNNKNKRWDVGVANPLHYEEKKYKIEPYLLGVWLGDGHSACGRITNTDDDVWCHIKKLGYNVSHPIGIARNVYDLMPALRDIGVLNNKHIPRDYLEGSINQRIELLRGLMDSDGHCNTRGTATFVNQNSLLVEGVYELALSLGMRPRLRKYTPSYNPSFWQISFQAKDYINPFRISRKANRAIKASHYDGCRTVKSIHKIESVPTRCIQVEGGAYLAGEHLIPTLNSTIITFGLTIQDILNDPEITIGLFSHTRPIAKAFLSQIMGEFEYNEELKYLYDDILWANPRTHAPKWSLDGGIVVQRQGNPKEATIEAWGLVDGMPTSKHFKLRVYDDIVTEKSVTSPEMIRKTTDKWALSNNLGTQGGRERYIGTRYHLYDTYYEMIKREAVKVRKHPATSDGSDDCSKSVLMPPDVLASKRKKQGIYIFGCQMLQNPVSDRSQSFKPEWWQVWPATSKNNLNIGILADPASGRQKTDREDFTSFFVVGRGGDDNWYILDMVRDKLSLTDRQKTLFALHRMWRPVFVGYEETGLSADIEHFKYVMGIENYRFNITALGCPLSKLDRIKRLVPVFESKRLWFPDRLVKTDYQGLAHNLPEVFRIEEYEAFPNVRHDDMLDCLSRLCDKEVIDGVPIPQPVEQGFNALKEIRRRQRKNRPVV